MAFTVTLDASAYVDTDEIVIFDKIITNVGPHFSLESRAFLCPYTGIYSFFVTVTDDDGNFVNGQLRVENEFIIRSRTNSDGYEGQGSNMAVVECQRGQRVWVRAGDSGTYRAGGDTTFSGFLIHVYDG